MELNDGTLQVLKNFSGINQNILIKQGNTLKTISEARNVLARATLKKILQKILGFMISMNLSVCYHL